MQVQELFQRDELKPEDRKRCRLPTYDKDPGVPAYILSEDGGSIIRVTHSRHVIVPLLDREEHILMDLAMALIEVAIKDRKEEPLRAATVRDAVIAGAEALRLADLRMEAVLVRTGTEVPAVNGVSRIAHHDDVEPGLVICLPDSPFLGFMPVVRQQSFGMLLHNPLAVVPVRVTG